MPLPIECHILSSSPQVAIFIGLQSTKEKVLRNPMCAFDWWATAAVGTMERRANWKQVITYIGSLFCSFPPRDESRQIEWTAGKIIIRFVVPPFAINLIRACPRLEIISWTASFEAVGPLYRLLYYHFEPKRPTPSIQSSPGLVVPALTVTLSYS